MGEPFNNESYQVGTLSLPHSDKFYVIGAGVAKLPEVQCISMKILIQTCTLATCQKCSILSDYASLDARKIKLFGVHK